MPFTASIYLLLMPSPPAQRTHCSGCARPWISTQFLSCDDCRRKAAQTRLRAREQNAALRRSNLSTGPPPSPASPIAPVFNTQRVFCSACARPWQSTRYRTCDRCRQARTRRETVSYKVRRADNPSGLSIFLTLHTEYAPSHSFL